LRSPPCSGARRSSGIDHHGTKASTPALVRALERLEQVPAGWLLTAGLLSAGVIGAADVAVGSSLSLRFLYIVPIFVFTWLLGAPGGIVVSAACAGMTLVSTAAAGQDVDALAVLNAGLRFVVFGLAVAFIQQLRLLVERERQRARHDPMTGALTRWAFLEMLEVERSRAERTGSCLGIMHVDLNRFDLRLDGDDGISADERLRSLVGVLIATADEVDHVGRLGGDEFAMVVRGCDVRRAHAVADEIRRSMIALAPDGQRLGPQVGLVLFERLPTDAEALLRAADELAYDARADDGVVTAVIGRDPA
jgi:diguanylate cyclase (GGDEF)-like protein